MARLVPSLLSVLTLLCSTHAIAASPLHELDDKELSQVVGGDGLSFAAHVVLNNPALVGAVTNSLAIGFNGGGQSTYVVLKNVSGTVDMFAVSLGVQQQPDGSDYVAIGLPSYVKYTNFGFESLSVQTDPTAPVASSMGSVNVNGTFSLQGQIRIWSH